MSDVNPSNSWSMLNPKDAIYIFGSFGFREIWYDIPKHGSRITVFFIVFLIPKLAETYWLHTGSNMETPQPRLRTSFPRCIAGSGDPQWFTAIFHHWRWGFHLKKSAGLPACLIGRCCSCSVLGLYLCRCSLATRFCFPLLSPPLSLPSSSPLY